MVNRTQLLVVTLIVITLTSLLTVFFSAKREEEYKPGISDEADQAVNRAQALYHEKKALGLNFSNGPCLTNDLLPEWVADIVHNPREEIDELSQNQCQAYREGRSKYFVEMDPDGNLVRVKFPQ